MKRHPPTASIARQAMDKILSWQGTVGRVLIMRRQTATLAPASAPPPARPSPHPSSTTTWSTKNPAPPALTVPFRSQSTETTGINAAALRPRFLGGKRRTRIRWCVLRDGKLVGDWRFGKPAGSRDNIGHQVVSQPSRWPPRGARGGSSPPDVPVWPWFPMEARGKRRLLSPSATCSNQTSASRPTER